MQVSVSIEINNYNAKSVLIVKNNNNITKTKVLFNHPTTYYVENGKFEYDWDYLNGILINKELANVNYNNETSTKGFMDKMLSQINSMIAKENYKVDYLVFVVHNLALKRHFYNYFSNIRDTKFRSIMNAKLIFTTPFDCAKLYIKNQVIDEDYLNSETNYILLYLGEDRCFAKAFMQENKDISCPPFYFDKSITLNNDVKYKYVNNEFSFESNRADSQIFKFYNLLDDIIIDAFDKSKYKYLLDNKYLENQYIILARKLLFKNLQSQNNVFNDITIKLPEIEGVSAKTFDLIIDAKDLLAKVNNFIYEDGYINYLLKLKNDLAMFSNTNYIVYAFGDITKIKLLKMYVSTVLGVDKVVFVEDDLVNNSNLNENMLNSIISDDMSISFGAAYLPLETYKSDLLLEASVKTNNNLTRKIVILSKDSYLYGITSSIFYNADLSKIIYISNMAEFTIPLKTIMSEDEYKEYNINFILNGKEINLNNRLYTKVDNKYQINKFKFETNNIVEFKGRIGIYRKFNKSIVVLCLYYNDLNYVVPIDDHIESI